MEPALRVRSSGHGGSGYKHPLTGEVVPGVTTVLKKLEKPGITQWAVDNTAAYAVANIDALLSRTEEQGYGFLRWYWKRDPLAGDITDIRNYSNGVLNDAAELGTLLHDWVAADAGVGDIPYPDVTGAPEYFWEMLDQWNLWRQNHMVDQTHTEVTFWSSQYGYAGTADGVWDIDGVRTLVDLKTSRNTWDEHMMQLAALGACDTMLVQEGGKWIEEPTPDFSQYALLHVRPSDTDKEGNPMFPFAELKVVPTEEIPLHFEAFEGVLRVTKAQAELKKLRRNSE